MCKYYSFILIVFLYLSASGTILHVPENYDSINAAVNVMLSGDTILVAPGIYVENLNIEEKDFTLASLYYTTQDTSYISTTIIDGGEVDCVIRIKNTEDTTSVISGFTITGGRQIGEYPDNEGAGLYCKFSTLTMSHLIIENNYAVSENDQSICGGGIYCSVSNLQISDTIIRNNQTPNGSGAGIYAVRSHLDLTNVMIINNIAHNETNTSQGGGICISSSNSININNSVISGNSSDYGGGIYIGNNNAVLDNIVMENNHAGNDGGAVCCTSSNPVLSNMVINNNTASFGGGIMCFENASPSLTDIVISNNSALSGGGICCLTESSPELKDVVILNNTSTHESSGGGGVLFWGSSFPHLENVSFSGNSAADTGGAMLCGHNANPVMINCILWDDSPQEIACFADHDPNSLTIAYCDVQDGEEAILTSNNCTINWLDGNIDADPLWLEDLQLIEESPCLDTGIAWYVYNDEVLIYLPHDAYYGPYPDMGAYEYFYIGEEENYIEKPNTGLTCYPNPFNPVTNISYRIAENCLVNLDIYNIKGQFIINLVKARQTAGKHSVIWNGVDARGKEVSSGVYFSYLQTSKISQKVKMILLK